MRQFLLREGDGSRRTTVVAVKAAGAAAVPASSFRERRERPRAVSPSVSIPTHKTEGILMTFREKGA